MYNAKNYTEQGGEKTVIGGTLEILEGATVTGLSSLSSTPLPIAEKQEESTATSVEDLRDDLNSLIGKLKSAGLMKES